MSGWVRPSVWLMAAMALLVVLGGVMFGLTGGRTAPVVVSTEAAADVSIERFTMFRTRAGRVEWELVAGRAELFEREHLGRLESLRALLYGGPGEQMTIVGDIGEIDTRTRDFWIARQGGAIELALANGLTVVATRFQWAEATEILMAPGAVQIQAPGVEIHGEDFRARVAIQEWELVNGVQARIVR